MIRTDIMIISKTPSVVFLRSFLNIIDKHGIRTGIYELE